MNIEGFDFEICCFTCLFTFVGKVWCSKVVDTSVSKAQYLSVSIQFLQMNSLVQVQYLSWKKVDNLWGEHMRKVYSHPPTNIRTYMDVIRAVFVSYVFALRNSFSKLYFSSFHTDTRPDNILLFWSGDKVKFIIDIQFPFFFSQKRILSMHMSTIRLWVCVKWTPLDYLRLCRLCVSVCNA